MSQIVIHGFGVDAGNHIRFGLGAGVESPTDTFVPGSGGGGSGGHWPPGSKTKPKVVPKPERPVEWTLRNARVNVHVVVSCGGMEFHEPEPEYLFSVADAASLHLFVDGRIVFVDRTANNAEVVRVILMSLGLQ